MPTEADTCRKFVVPKLVTAGWDNEPHSIAEQRTITDGRIIPAGAGFVRKPPKRVDYLLRYTRDFPLAVVEAKAAYKHAAAGLQQAKAYAEMLGLKFAYATNGHEIIEFDYLTGRESGLASYPTPTELWDRYRNAADLPPKEAEQLLTPYNHTVEKGERYYQQIAINRTVEAILKGRRRLLLTMATGTGKTAAAAGVSHYIALSVVNSDRIHDSGYLRAKRVQEGLIEASGIPYTVLRATQFFEFLKAVADAGTEGNVVHMSPYKFQPVAADDVAATLAEIATAPPKNGVVELAGPEATSMAEFIQSFLSSIGDNGRSFPIRMRSTSERSSTKTAWPRRVNSLLDRHAFLIGHAPKAEPLIKRSATVKKTALLLLAGVLLLPTNVAAETNTPPASKVTKIFDRELPNVSGKSLRAVLVEYGPGAASPSRRHPSSAFIYATVLEGEIRSQVNDQPEHVYKTGESWTEQPGDHQR